jgi:hypothetical protein
VQTIPINIKRLLLIVSCLAALSAHADPWVAPGDLVLRQDIQRLADAGVIRSPVTTWPIPWATIARDLDALDTSAGLDPGARVALQRVQGRLSELRRVSGIQPSARTAVTTDPFWLRTFADTPRDDTEFALGASWMGDRFAVRLEGSYRHDPDDGQPWRMDNSYASVILGNQILSAGAVDRWWGPGWESSLILTSNARPVAGFTLERNVAMPFESKWLSWIGPWNYSLLWGFLGDNRFRTDARLLAFRAAFRPFPALEIGLSRSATWCGTGRPCDADALWDIVIGKDNTGEDGVTRESDPSNQFAAIDGRWTSPIGDAPYALYTQWMANDEVNGLPSEWTAIGGVEVWGDLDWTWLAGSWTAHFEAMSTIADFYEGEPNYNRTYNHNIYRTGYRYEERAIGAAADGDSIVVSSGVTLAEPDGKSWSALIRWSEINRNGDGEGQDLNHSVSPYELKVYDLHLTHERSFAWRGWQLGSVALGVGYQRRESDRDDSTNDDFTGYLQWTWDLQDH